MFPGSLGPGEMLVIMVVAVLVFGKRLPEVGRSLGKGLVEFKKGLAGVGDDEPDLASKSSVPARTGESHLDAGPDYAVPKFEPPVSAPARETETVARTPES